MDDGGRTDGCVRVCVIVHVYVHTQYNGVSHTQHTHIHTTHNRYESSASIHTMAVGAGPSSSSSSSLSSFASPHLTQPPAPAAAATAGPPAGREEDEEEEADVEGGILVL